jgi:hypothetical protein
MTNFQIVCDYVDPTSSSADAEVCAVGNIPKKTLWHLRVRGVFFDPESFKSAVRHSH